MSARTIEAFLEGDTVPDDAVFLYAGVVVQFVNEVRVPGTLRATEPILKFFYEVPIGVAAERKRARDEMGRRRRA